MTSCDMRDRAKESLREIDDDFGCHPGYRAAQAKGVVCRGTFKAGTDPEELTSAAHLKAGKVTPVTVRFSNFTANPSRHDGLSDVRGMATAFHLGSGRQTDITALRMPSFFVGTAEHFLRWQRAIIRNPLGDLPLPTPRFLLDVATRRLPPLAGWRQVTPLCRIPSYAACRYNSLHAYRWVKGTGSAFVRYSWVPEIPQEAFRAWQMAWWAAPRRDPDYLRAELAERLKRWPVRFRLEVQMQGAGDDPYDSSARWKSNQWLTAGALDITEVGGWDATGLAPLEFQPARVTPGIEVPEHDSLLQLREHVYAMSARRRTEDEGHPPRVPEIPDDADEPYAPFLDPDKRKSIPRSGGESDERIDIAYQESEGEDRKRPLLLIMGFACSMAWWDRRFCDMLEERGFHLIRFDNRDSGRSSRGGRTVPKVRGLLAPGRYRQYLIDDMAGDAAHLLEELGIERAHVMGISLGGMVAQALAINHGDKVLSLTTINAAPQIRIWPPSRWPSLPVALRLFQPQPTGREQRWVDWSIPLWRSLNGRGFGFERERGHIERLLHIAWAWGGGNDPEADMRQLLAVLASPDRTEGLRRLELPALVVYGTDDQLVRPIGGLETLRAIPGARGMCIEGMGHYTPRDTWPQIVEGIDQIAAQADGGDGGQGPATLSGVAQPPEDGR